MWDRPVNVEPARRLRRKMTLPEVILWQALRGDKLKGMRFRRQHPVGPYVLDFFSAEARLGVEVDGSAHEHPDQVRHDQVRDAWLEKRGVRVLRIAACDILRDEFFDDVLRVIKSAAYRAAVSPPPPFASQTVPLPR